MTSSRSQAIFIVSNTFSVGSALVQHSRVTSSWQKTSARIRALSWLSMFWWSMAALKRNREKGLLPLSSVSTMLILDMSIFRAPAVLRKALDQFCLHRKEQRAAENDFLARLQRFFTCPTTISRVRRSLVERRPRVIKDRTPKNTTLLVLDHHPLYRTGRVSRAIRKMFEYPLKHCLTTLGVIQNPLR